MGGNGIPYAVTHIHFHPFHPFQTKTKIPYVERKHKNLEISVRVGKKQRQKNNGSIRT